MVLMIVIAVLGRLMPHPANMTPMGALSVFAGSRFGVKRGVVVTMAAMLLSDLVVGLHPVMWATYGALFLGVVLGRYGVRRVRVPAVVGAVLSSSVLFFLITNLRP